MKNLLQQNKQKIKDFVYSVGAIAILNLIIQLVLYPILDRKLGDAKFGAALSLLAVVSITANSVGSAANYSRLVSQKRLNPSNGDYNLFLLLGGFLSAVVGVVYLYLTDILSVTSAVCVVILMLVTTFRYYSDTEFKLQGSSLKYFFFYCSVAVGYLFGLLVYRLLGEWSLALTTGEVFGILFAVLFSGLYKAPLRPSVAFGAVWKSAGLLLLSNLITNLTLNADRLILQVLESDLTVSVYYTASLFGKIIALLSVPLNAVIISYLVRYEKGLTKKLWTYFCLASGAVSVLALGGCLIGSYIMLPFLYPTLYPAAKAILFPAILSQIFYFVSGVLLIVLLRFRGEKKQMLVNLAYGILFFALTVWGTLTYGLTGFVWTSTVANALRCVFAVVWGFIPPKTKKENQAEEPSAMESIS